MRFSPLALHSKPAPLPQVELHTDMEDVFTEKLRFALNLREQHFKKPYYRLIHGAGDGLPGLIIDRFDGLCVLQMTTPGMEHALPRIIAALDATICPSAILLRNDFAERASAGLPREASIIRGQIPAHVNVLENNFRYTADLLHGPQTGWDYSQRDSRAMLAGMARDRSILELYSQGGTYGLLALSRGARRATMIESSSLTLELARESARQNAVEEMCTLRKANMNETINTLKDSRVLYGAVVVGPAAVSALDAEMDPAVYTKLAQEAAVLVQDAGLLMVTCDTPLISRSQFRETVLQGIKHAGRTSTVLHYSGHPADHPVAAYGMQNDSIKALLVRCQFS